MVHLLHFGFSSPHYILFSNLYDGHEKGKLSALERTLIRLFLQARQPPRDFRWTLRGMKGFSSPCSSPFGISILNTVCILDDFAMSFNCSYCLLYEGYLEIG